MSTPTSKRSRKLKEPCDGTPLSVVDSSFKNRSEKVIYFRYFAPRKLLQHRFISLEWLRRYRFSFVDDLVYQRLDTLMTLRGKIYPELVKIFYANLDISDDGYLTSQVGGKNIVFMESVWLKLLGISNLGADLKRSQMKNFNSKDTYLDTLCDKGSFRDGCFTTKHMLTNNKILFYLFDKIILPRCDDSEEVCLDYLKIAYCLKNKIRLNWVEIISMKMLDAIKREAYNPFPYGLLISKLLELYCVDVSDEPCYDSWGLNEIREEQLESLDITLENGMWMTKEEKELNEKKQQDEDFSTKNVLLKILRSLEVMKDDIKCIEVRLDRIEEANNFSD